MTRTIRSLARKLALTAAAAALAVAACVFGGDLAVTLVAVAVAGPLAAEWQR